MMRREWLVVWCGAAILIAATVLVCLADESQGRMMRDQMHDGHDQGNQEEQTANNFKHLLKHAKEIGLTPEQIGRLKAMQLDFSRTQSRMEADIKIATLELDALLEEEQTELSTIQAKINELKQAEGALLLAAITSKREATAMLTPDQREKDRVHREKMKSKGKGEQHGGEGGGGDGGGHQG
ncbi:MAG: periplasmic heavy metal sensor, partial [Nitrospira sp.]|nr:periplasmic heavy metal sensor [Nitrospira sp.]